MTTLPSCTKCASSSVYEDQGLLICPECAHEWSKEVINETQNEEGANFFVRDANGIALKDGDTVLIIKDLKLKGSSDVVKVGTKVKNIRLVDSDHNIDCKVPGIGQMGLKSEFVKKIAE